MQHPSFNAHLENFITLIREGITCWVDAGVLLIEMCRINEYAYDEIINREPMLTVDMLKTIERIGRKEIYPHVILDRSMAAKHLLRYKYDDQVKLCTEPVYVVDANKPNQVSKKMVRELSRHETEYVMGVTAVRTVEQQKEFLRINGNTYKVKRKTGPVIDTPQNKPTTPPPPALKLIGRWMIRKGIGNNVGFERTNAIPNDSVKVILEDGIKAIEVYSKQ